MCMLKRMQTFRCGKVSANVETKSSGRVVMRDCASKG